MLFFVCFAATKLQHWGDLFVALFYALIFFIIFVGQYCLFDRFACLFCRFRYAHTTPQTPRLKKVHAIFSGPCYPKKRTVDNLSTVENDSAGWKNAFNRLRECSVANG